MSIAVLSLGLCVFTGLLCLAIVPIIWSKDGAIFRALISILVTFVVVIYYGRMVAGFLMDGPVTFDGLPFETRGVHLLLFSFFAVAAVCIAVVRDAKKDAA